MLANSNFFGVLFFLCFLISNQGHSQFAGLIPSPLLADNWQELNIKDNEKYTDKFLELLRKDGYSSPDKLVFLKQRQVTFYKGGNLLHFGGVVNDTLRSYYVMQVSGNYHLIDGNSSVIYTMNEAYGLDFEGEHNILEYGTFFIHSLNSEHGRFRMIRNIKDLTNYMLGREWRTIHRPVMPPEIIQRNENELILSSLILYAGYLYQAKIKIEYKGKVSLFDEKVINQHKIFCDHFFEGGIKFYNLNTRD